MFETQGLPAGLKLTFLIALIVVMLLAFFIVLAVMVYSKKQQSLLTEKRLMAAEHENELLARALSNLKTLQAERERISQDMHDDIGSNLSSIRLQTQLIKNAVEDPAVRAELDEILNDVAQMNNGMREMIWSLQSQHDELLSFVSYITLYAQNLLGKAQIALDSSSDISASYPLNSNVRRNLFLIIKEALHNIVKHSRAAQAGLHFALNDNQLTIRVTDNGIGMAQSTNCDGNGLLNMKNRMNAIGGLFEIQSKEGNTTLSLSVQI